MAAACGLAGPATVRRVDQVTRRLLAELSAAVEEVAAMPAGAGGLLNAFADTDGERARLVRANAGREEDFAADASGDLAEGESRYGDV